MTDRVRAQGAGAGTPTVESRARLPAKVKNLGGHLFLIGCR
jgi:hypothetical protein